MQHHNSKIAAAVNSSMIMGAKLKPVISFLLYLGFGCAFTQLRSSKAIDSQNHVLFGLRSATTSEELLNDQHFRINGRWTANVSHEGMRLSDFLNAIAPETFPSSTSSKNAIRRGLIRLNGGKAKSSDGILNDDVIENFVRSQQGIFCNDFGGKATVNPEAYGHCTVQVLWEDSHLAVVIKPQGMPVFRTKETGSLLKTQSLDHSTEGSCLQSALPYSLSPVPYDSNLQPLRRPRAVHRLDTGTGGLILVAKTRPALINLTDQFAQRTVSKSYRAIVVGKLDGNNGASSTTAEHTVTQPVNRLQGSICNQLSGQTAETDWSVEPGMQTMSKTYGWITTVDLKPRTGRTHQLRRHMDLMRHPIMGDPDYWFQDGGRLVPFSTVAGTNGQITGNVVPLSMPRLEGRGIYLWSVGISFDHPVTGNRVELTIPEPESYSLLRADLKSS